MRLGVLLFMSPLFLQVAMSMAEQGEAGPLRGASFSHHRPRSLISGGILWSPEPPSVLGGSQPFAWLNVGFRSSAVYGLQGKSSLALRCTTFHYENGRSIMCVGRMFAWPHCHFRDSHQEIIPLRARACVTWHRVTSQTQPVKWITCRHNKYEIIFTHIHAGTTQERKENRGKEHIWGNWAKDAAWHFGATVISRPLHDIAWL